MIRETKGGKARKKQQSRPYGNGPGNARPTHLLFGIFPPGGTWTSSSADPVQAKYNSSRMVIRWKRDEEKCGDYGAIVLIISLTQFTQLPGSGQIHQLVLFHVVQSQTLGVCCAVSGAPNESGMCGRERKSHTSLFTCNDASKKVALSIFDSLCVKTYRFIQASGQSKVQPGGPIAAPGHIINVQQPLL